MPEKPILFSSPMVRAILDGRKTQTRRVVKPQPPSDPESCGSYHPLRVDKRGYEFPADETFGICGDGWDVPCPYGAPGDRLWVRETWHEGAGGKFPVCYRADVEWDSIEPWDVWPGVEPRWRASLYMPRAMSRIALELIQVRVERLQDAPDADIADEGTQYPVKERGGALIRVSGPYPPCQYHRPINLPAGEPLTHEEILRAHFASLWDQLNAKRGLSWESDPWIWAITFKRV